MKDTFTTIVTPTKDGIEIMTQHDQTGSASVNGFVPTENIPSLIGELKKFIGFNLPVSGNEANPSSENKKGGEVALPLSEDAMIETAKVEMKKHENLYANDYMWKRGFIYGFVEGMKFESGNDR